MAKDEETGTDAAKRINAKACKALLKDLRSGQDDIDEVKGRVQIFGRDVLNLLAHK